MIDGSGSGSIPLTNGSGRPKNMWIRWIRIQILIRNTVQESDYVMAGERLARPVSTPLGELGLGICYDLRFPEQSLALTLRCRGCNSFHNTQPFLYCCLEARLLFFFIFVCVKQVL